jgi:hypothetical protein
MVDLCIERLSGGWFNFESDNPQFVQIRILAITPQVWRIDETGSI